MPPWWWLRPGQPQWATMVPAGQFVLSSCDPPRRRPDICSPTLPPFVPTVRPAPLHWISHARPHYRRVATSRVLPSCLLVSPHHPSVCPLPICSLCVHERGQNRRTRDGGYCWVRPIRCYILLVCLITVCDWVAHRLTTSRATPSTPHIFSKSISNSLTIRLSHP